MPDGMQKNNAMFYQGGGNPETQNVTSKSYNMLWDQTILPHMRNVAKANGFDPSGAGVMSNAQRKDSVKKMS